MSAEILINPAKWRLCVADPAIYHLAHPPKSDAAAGTTHLRPSSSSAAPHKARMSTTITQEKEKKRDKIYKRINKETIPHDCI